MHPLCARENTRATQCASDNLNYDTNTIQLQPHMCPREYSRDKEGSHRSQLLSVDVLSTPRQSCLLISCFGILNLGRYIMAQALRTLLGIIVRSRSERTPGRKALLLGGDQHQVGEVGRDRRWR